MDSDNLLHLDQQLCFKLYTASRLMTRAYQPMLKALGITYPQYLALMVLWQQHQQGVVACSVTQLGEALLLDSGTLTPLLKRLQTNGFIERRRCDHDERVVEVRLTPQGLVLKEEASCWVSKAIAQSDVDIATIERLQTDLKVLIKNLLK